MCWSCITTAEKLYIDFFCVIPAWRKASLKTLGWNCHIITSRLLCERQLLCRSTVNVALYWKTDVFLGVNKAKKALLTKFFYRQGSCYTGRKLTHRHNCHQTLISVLHRKHRQYPASHTDAQWHEQTAESWITATAGGHFCAKTSVGAGCHAGKCCFVL